MEGRPIIYIIIVDIKIILEYYILISILLLIFVWLLNIDIIIYIYNNCGFFLIFILFIKRIVRVVTAFYKRGSISIIWRIPTGINYIINMVDILYIFNLFTNLFLVLKLKVNRLYIIIKNYII